ncbi:MAG: S24 family peptidase [Candidatus Paceibacterota bacterium]
MHKIQQNLLELSKTKNLGQMTLREMGEHIGEKFPQKIKHHLGQLEKKGFIKIAKNVGTIERTQPGKIASTSLLSIPILGTANCGPATFYADTNFEGYLKISSALLKKKKNIYAIRASGHSMNRANVAGKTIEDGDYLIVESVDKKPETGDVVVSVFDGVANIKKFHWDQENNRVVLISESTKDFPPIFIHEDDDFNVTGYVTQVVKNQI